MDKPKYNINDVIYLRESAILGFIESYKISGVQYDSHTNQWMYHINIKNRGPQTSMMLDRVDLRTKETLCFRESEIIEYCDAINLAINQTEQQLVKLKNIRDSRCPGTE